MYRIKKWLFERWKPQFQPEIPQELMNLGQAAGVDMNQVRYQCKRLSVDQVDEMLNAAGLTDTVSRMALKNYLVAMNLMVPGHIERDSSIGFLPFSQRGRSVDRPETLWKRGQSLQKKVEPAEQRSWAFPYRYPDIGYKITPKLYWRVQWWIEGQISKIRAWGGKVQQKWLSFWREKKWKIWKRYSG